MEAFNLGGTVYNNKYVCTGTFNYIDSSSSLNDTANNIAQWNDTSWSAIGTGLNNSGVFATTFNKNLIATGYFDSVVRGPKVKGIAQWDGSNWFALGAGLNDKKPFWGYGYMLTAFNKNLIVGGHFDTVDSKSANHIAQWDGTKWSALGSGCNGDVWALCVYHGNLYVGGTFDTAGGIKVNGIAMWDGSSWYSVGSGIAGNTDVVYVLYVFNSDLWAGRRFPHYKWRYCK